MLLEMCTSLTVVLPLFPCLAVACSTVLFVVVSVFDALRLDTSVLNPVVYVGTLYGPFGMVYYEAKRRGLRSGVLPGAGASDRHARPSGVTNLSRSRLLSLLRK